MTTAVRSDQIGELSAALSRAQAKMRGAVKDTEGQVGRQMRKYADLASTWEACRDALTTEGLAVAQLPQHDAAAGDAFLETVLMHSSGQWLASRIPLIYAENSGLNPMQTMGSALTYARRYGLAAMVGVAPEDDDGESAGHPAARREGRSELERPAHRGESQAPRTGKALFAWCKEMEQRHEVGLLKYLNGWAKLREFPGRMVDWDGEQAALGHEEAVRKLAAIGPARDEEAAAGDGASTPAAASDPKGWDALLAKAVDHWATFAPIATDSEQTAREHRIAQGLITDAATPAAKGEARSGWTLLDEDTVKSFNARGLPVRDPKKVWEAAKDLHDLDPAWVRKAIWAHLERERAKAESPVTREPGE